MCWFVGDTSYEAAEKYHPILQGIFSPLKFIVLALRLQSCCNSSLPPVQALSLQQQEAAFSGAGKYSTKQLDDEDCGDCNRDFTQER